jgi:hypothetical protein
MAITLFIHQHQKNMKIELSQFQQSPTPKFYPLQRRTGINPEEMNHPPLEFQH